MGKSSAAVREASLRPEEQARAERGAKLRAFFADPPPEVLAAADALGRARERYGEDTDRELADLEAGRHPLQRKAKPRAR